MAIAHAEIQEQALAVPYHRFTVDEYQWMGRTAILKPDDRVELLDGQVVDMTPIGPVHAFIVRWFNEALVPALKGKATVLVQDPVQLSNSQPQPDIAVARLRDDGYRWKHPGGRDLLLVVEVADSSLPRDRDLKARLYLLAGVPEVWVVDVEHRELLVFRDRESTRHEVVRSGKISPAAFPDLELQVAEILG
jgi:Uma2 family endonuclease